MKITFLFLSNNLIANCLELLSFQASPPSAPHLLTWLGLWTSSTLYLYNRVVKAAFLLFNSLVKEMKGCYLQVADGVTEVQSYSAHGSAAQLVTALEPVQTSRLISLHQWLLWFAFPAIPPSPNSQTPAFISRWRKKRGRENFAVDDSHTRSSTNNTPEVVVRYFGRVEFLTHATDSFSLQSLQASCSLPDECLISSSSSA